MCIYERKRFLIFCVLEITAIWLTKKYSKLYVKTESDADKPEKTKTELRIYQFDDILSYEPESEKVKEVMDAIDEKDRVLQKMKDSAWDWWGTSDTAYQTIINYAKWMNEEAKQK